MLVLMSTSHNLVHEICKLVTAFHNYCNWYNQQTYHHLKLSSWLIQFANLSLPVISWLIANLSSKLLWPHILKFYKLLSFINHYADQPTPPWEAPFVALAAFLGFLLLFLSLNLSLFLSLPW